MSQHRTTSFIVSACTVALAASFIVIAPVYAQESTKHSKSMHTGSMDHSKMGCMKDIDAMSMTGDADYDFAANMRMHHQVGVEMSEDFIKNGQDPQVLQMAKDIIAAQKKEIAVFDEWIEAHNKPMSKLMPKSK